jgi:hypothetical protein
VHYRTEKKSSTAISDIVGDYVDQQDDTEQEAAELPENVIPGKLPM